MKPTAKSYFSGAGLMDLGLILAGVDVIQSLDLDKRATNVMKLNSHYFNHKIITGDMRETTVLDQPKSDVHVFTYPCDRYSTIADIHGVRTGDEQYLHALRHVALEQPQMFVAENVPGMRKFKVVMEAMTKLPGYYIKIFCPLNSSLWLPQDRKRLIIIATKKHFSISEPRRARNIPTIKSILERNVSIRVNDSVIARIKGKYRDMPIIVDPADKNAIAPTCVAHYAKDMGTRLVKDKNYRHGVRPFTAREYARLQGLPDDYILPQTNFAYELSGNGVSVPKARWIGKQIVKYFNQ
jgi:DNA (cytosine-5)-methyltransferase 1